MDSLLGVSIRTTLTVSALIFSQLPRNVPKRQLGINTITLIHIAGIKSVSIYNTSVETVVHTVTNKQTNDLTNNQPVLSILDFDHCIYMYSITYL